MKKELLKGAIGVTLLASAVGFLYMWRYLVMPELSQAFLANTNQAQVLLLILGLTILGVTVCLLWLVWLTVKMKRHVTSTHASLEPSSEDGN